MSRLKKHFSQSIREELVADHHCQKQPPPMKPLSFLKKCKASFYPHICAASKTLAGRQSIASELQALIDKAKISLSEASGRLEARLVKAQNYPAEFWRARIMALEKLGQRQRKVRNRHREGSKAYIKEDRKVMALRCGVFPPGFSGRKAIEKQMQKSFPAAFKAWKAGRSSDASTLSFTELARFNTWLSLHPEKILGIPDFDTSRGFPIGENGSAQEANQILMQLTPENMETPIPSNVDPVLGATKPGKDQAKPPFRLSLSLIKKYLGLDGRSKSRKQIGALLDELQKAVSSGKIHQGHPHGQDIMYMQKKLIGLFNDMVPGEKRTLKLRPEIKQDFAMVVSWKGQAPDKMILQALLGLNGKPQKAARKLSVCLKRSQGQMRFSQSYADLIGRVAEFLRKATEQKGSFNLPESLLSDVRKALGMEDSPLAGIGEESPADVEIIPSDQIPDNSHLQYDFGPWTEIFRRPLPGFWAMVFGRDKLGKSTLVNQFMKYLAHKGHRILWIEFEEDIAGVFNARLERLKAKHPNMAVAAGIPSDLCAFEFVVINSVSEENLSPKYLSQLKKRYKGSGINFVLIYKATKDGDYMGESGHGHLPDIKIEVKKKGRAQTTGRYGVGQGKIPYTAAEWEKLSGPQSD